MLQVVYPSLLMFSVQCVTAFASIAVPVLLPAFAAEVGVASAFAGTATAMVYAGAMITAYLFSARVERSGAVRSCQAMLLMVAAGLAVCSTGTAEALILGSLAIGAGLGPVTSASTSLLTRFTPAEYYGIAFSLNRISVPAGAAVAAVVLPLLSQRVGWQLALCLGAAVPLLLGGALQLARRLDHRAAVDACRPAQRRDWFEPLRAVFGDRRRGLLAKASLVYFAAQSCLASFTVAFLVNGIGLPHIEAGAILAAAQVSGVVTRVVLGIVTDRVSRRVALCGFVGLSIALACGIAAIGQPGWPPSAWMAIFLLYGVGGLGWNGVVLAELAHSSPRERAGEIAGAFASVTFVGAIVGPAVFSGLLSVSGYPAGYGSLAVAALIASVALIRLDGAGPHSIPLQHLFEKAKDPP